MTGQRVHQVLTGPTIGLQGCFYLDYVAFWGIDDPVAKAVVPVGIRVGGAPHSHLGL